MPVAVTLNNKNIVDKCFRSLDESVDQEQRRRLEVDQELLLRNRTLKK